MNLIEEVAKNNPELADLLATSFARATQSSTREPNSVQWQHPDGWVIGYTTEKWDADAGKPVANRFGAFMYKPVGPGSKGGWAVMKKKRKNTWKLHTMRYRAKRKDAKAIAEKWYDEHTAAWKAKQAPKPGADGPESLKELLRF